MPGSDHMTSVELGTKMSVGRWRFLLLTITHAMFVYILCPERLFPDDRSDWSGRGVLQSCCSLMTLSKVRCTHVTHDRLLRIQTLTTPKKSKINSKLRVSRRIQEKVVVQKPRHGGVQLSFFLRLRLRLHGDVFGRLGVGADVLGDQRLVLPLQPVSHHVTFALLKTDRPRVLPGSSWGPQGPRSLTEVTCGGWATHLDLHHPSALQQVAADLLQQVKRTGAALDLQGCKHMTWSVKEHSTGFCLIYSVKNRSFIFNRDWIKYLLHDGEY